MTRKKSSPVAIHELKLIHLVVRFDIVPMKYIAYFLLLLISINCSAQEKIAEESKYPTRFVFKKSLLTTQQGVAGLKSKTDSLIDAQYNPQGKDSLVNKDLKEVQMTQFLTQSPDTEIHVEIRNDSIWRYTKQNGKLIGDYLLIQKNGGILYYYDKSRSVNYSKYDLFDEIHKYGITENRNSRKEISGFQCYKLILIKENLESDLGNTIYEMYVTDQIALPIHSVINLTKFVPNTFPMEIIVTEEKLPGIAVKYELIEIE